MGDSIQVVSAQLLNLRVSSTLNDFMAEKRFDRGLTIADVKMRLEMVTGASAGQMIVTVLDHNDRELFALQDNDALLGSHCIEENYRLHVSDNSKKFGEFDDLSKVQKFELSEDSYDEKQDTVRSYLRRNKLGKFNAEEMAEQQHKEEARKEELKQKLETIHLGDRCEVRSQGEPTRRGAVRFVGETSFKEGTWVGVQYDEPLGKNDGSVGGKRYFTCPAKYGGFTRPANVFTGDFPELDYDDEEM